MSMLPVTNGSRPAALYRVSALSTPFDLVCYFATFIIVVFAIEACIPINTEMKDTHEQSDHDDRTLSPDIGVKKDKVGDTTQEGLINISAPSTSSALGWIVAAVLGGVVYLQRVALRRARSGLKHCHGSIELLGMDGEHVAAMRELKYQIAKAEARKFGVVEKVSGRRCKK